MFRTVMRVREGEQVEIFNGRDGQWGGRVAYRGGGTILLCQRLLRVQPCCVVPSVGVVFALVRSVKMGFLVQKGTELGVGVFQPILTQRCTVRSLRKERLKSQAKEAAEQCGRLTVPEVCSLLSLEEFSLSLCASSRLFFCDEMGGEDFVDVLRASDMKRIRNVWVLVGPEGGFSPAERASLRKRKFVTPVSLGTRLLRSDTAALAALVIYQFFWGDKHR